MVLESNLRFLKQQTTGVQRPNESFLFRKTIQLKCWFRSKFRTLQLRGFTKTMQLHRPQLKLVCLRSSNPLRRTPLKTTRLMTRSIFPKLATTSSLRAHAASLSSSTGSRPGIVRHRKTGKASLQSHLLHSMTNRIEFLSSKID